MANFKKLKGDSMDNNKRILETSNNNITTVALKTPFKTALMVALGVAVAQIIALVVLGLIFLVLSQQFIFV